MTTCFTSTLPLPLSHRFTNCTIRLINDIDRLINGIHRLINGTSRLRNQWPCIGKRQGRQLEAAAPQLDRPNQSSVRNNEQTPEVKPAAGGRQVALTFPLMGAMPFINRLMPLLNRPCH